MATDKLVAPLRRVPILAGLKPLQITEIARQAERVKFGQDEVITRDGEPGDGAYLIVSGRADRVFHTGATGATEPIEPGSLVGEMAMLIEHDYRATVVARERVLCLKITRAAIHVQMLEDNTLALHFESHIRDRLQRVSKDLHKIDRMLAAWASNVAQPDLCKDLAQPLDAELSVAATAG